MRIITLDKKTILRFFFCIVFSFVLTNSFSQCPTVVNQTQTFCDTQSPKISNLTATNNGGGVAWFETPTSKTALPSSIFLKDGSTYYADNTAGNCGTRPAVLVKIYSAPLGSPFYVNCVENANDVTVANLTAIGNNIKWYNQPTGGAALPSTTVLVDETFYYASQTNPTTGCETSRLSTYVNFGVVPIPTGSSSQKFCDDPDNPPTVSDLVATGGNIFWYASATSSQPLPSTTPLVDGQSYYAQTVDLPCKSESLLQVDVTLVPQNDPGKSSEKKICVSNLSTMPSFDLYNELNGTPDETGVWSGPIPTTNGYKGTLNVSTLTLAGSPYVFTYSVASSLCATSTATVTIIVTPLPTVAISSGSTICSGENATITFTGTPEAEVTYKVNGGNNQTILLNSSGTATITDTFDTTTIYSLVSVASVDTPDCVQLQTETATITVIPLPVVTISSDKINVCPDELATVTFTGTPNATVIYNINGGSNQTIILNNSGTAEIIKTYSETTIYSLVSVSIAGTLTCNQPQTGTITITYIPLPKVTISGSTSICPEESATITFTGTPNATVTYTVNGGNEQIIQLDVFGIGKIKSTYSITTTYTLVNVFTENSNCIQLQTGEAIITVLPLPIVTISSDVTVCSGSNATVIFTGTPNAIVTYTINDGNNQNITLNASGTASFTTVYSATTIIKLVKVETAEAPNCSQSQPGTMTISVTQPPIAGNNATLPLCSNSNPQDLFLLLGPTAQIGGTWSPSMASGTGIYNPLVDPAGIYTYTLTATPPCTDVSATITISIFPAPNAGTSGTASLCSNGNSIDLFTYLGGTPQSGGTWTPTLASGSNIFDPSVDVAGDYTYTIAGVSPCDDATAIVSVAVTPGPNAGKDGKATFCTNSSSQDLFFSLGGKPQMGGTWSPSLASGTGIFNPQVDAPGIYTYFFEGTQPCDSDAAVVEVVINPIPDAGQKGDAFFCTNYPPQDLFFSLSGTPQTGGTWSPALASGTGIFNPKIDKAGNYTYNVGGGYCNLATAVVAVSVSQSPNAGGANAKLFIDACSTATAVDLTTALNGTQSPGVWTDDDKSGALNDNIFNPSAAGIGTYHFTYTVGGGVSPCLFDTATVTVVVSPQPNTGTFTGIQNVCSIAGTFDLFNLLSGYQTGGIWTDSSGSLIVNPLNVSNLNPATYSYTYTIKNGCGTMATVVQIAVFKTPNISGATLNAGVACLGFSNQVIIANASGLTNGNYTITYSLSGANTTTATSSATIASGNGSFIIPASQLPNPGEIALKIDLITPEASPCGANGNIIAPVTFNVISIPTPELQPNGNEFCASDNPTIATLSNNVVGSETLSWYNTSSGGSALTSSTLLENGVTYYGSYQDNSGCGSTTRLAVTVDLTKCNDIIIPDGFSPNGDGINDTFFIKNLDILYPNFNLEIYNRYGNVVYQGNINSPVWDGNATAGGAKLGNSGVPVGVYFYVLSYNDGSKKPTQGRIYLSR